MKAWHTNATAKRLCHWCGLPAAPDYRTACITHRERTRQNNKRNGIQRRAFAEDAGLCVVCKQAPRIIGQKCRMCSERNAGQIRERRAKRRAIWMSTVRKRHLLSARETANVLGLTGKFHTQNLHYLIRKGLLPAPIQEWSQAFYKDEDVYALLRARIRAKALRTLRECTVCGHIWPSMASRLPIRCPVPSCHSTDLRESTMPWKMSLPDWTRLRPTNRRGAKPKGQYILCDSCKREVWRRPSFLKKGARFCSISCAMDDPQVAAACGSYGGTRWDTPPAWPYIAEASPEDKASQLLLTVHQAVPHGLPMELRADICQDIVIAILNGELKETDIQVNLKNFIKKGYKNFGSNYGNISLDAPLSDDDERTRLDFVTSRSLSLEAMLCQNCEASSEIHDDGLCFRCWTEMQNRLAVVTKHTDFVVHHPPKPVHRLRVDERTAEMLKQEGRRPLERMSGHTRRTRPDLSAYFSKRNRHSKAPARPAPP